MKQLLVSSLIENYEDMCPRVPEICANPDDGPVTVNAGLLRTPGGAGRLGREAPQRARTPALL